MCDYFSKQYPALNRDLLLTAAMFHDIGKTKELSAFPENDYTDEGQLLGHIIIGVQMLEERIAAMPGFPKKLEHELIHCILAHHGELEYGSPKKPALIEALALNLADNADAKLETMTEILKGAGDNMGWLGYNRFMESNVRRTHWGCDPGVGDEDEEKLWLCQAGEDPGACAGTGRAPVSGGQGLRRLSAPGAGL